MVCLVLGPTYEQVPLPRRTEWSPHLPQNDAQRAGDYGPDVPSQHLNPPSDWKPGLGRGTERYKPLFDSSASAGLSKVPQRHRTLANAGS